MYLVEIHQFPLLVVYAVYAYLSLSLFWNILLNPRTLVSDRNLEHNDSILSDLALLLDFTKNFQRA